MKSLYQMERYYPQAALTAAEKQCIYIAYIQTWFKTKLHCTWRRGSRKEAGLWN